MELFNLKLKTDIQNNADLNQQRNDFIIARNMFEVMLHSTSASRLSTLVKKLAKSDLNDYFKSHILSNMKKIDFKLEIYNVNSSHLGDVGLTISKEKNLNQSSEAMQILSDRVLFNKKNIFDSL